MTCLCELHEHKNRATRMMGCSRREAAINNLVLPVMVTCITTMKCGQPSLQHCCPADKSVSTACCSSTNGAFMKGSSASGEAKMNFFFSINSCSDVSMNLLLSSLLACSSLRFVPAYKDMKYPCAEVELTFYFTKTLHHHSSIVESLDKIFTPS